MGDEYNYDIERNVPARFARLEAQDETDMERIRIDDVLPGLIEVALKERAWHRRLRRWIKGQLGQLQTERIKRTLHLGVYRTNE